MPRVAVQYRLLLLLILAVTRVQPTLASERSLDESIPRIGLAQLNDLQNPQLTPGKRLLLGLHLYRDEMLHPTPRPKPPYTDYKTHDYVLAQITRKLATAELDLPALRKTWETMNPGEVKDSLTLLLLLRASATGQPAKHTKDTKKGETPAPAAWPATIRGELQEQVSTFVKERGNPLRLRELGVEALGQSAIVSGDSSVGQVLAQVIREDVQSQYKAAVGKNGKPTGEIVLVYPVRQAAAAAIKRMEQEGLLLESYVTVAAQRARVEAKLPPRPTAPARK